MIESKLQDMVTALGQITDIKTAKLGLEKGISHADYPIIRVVPGLLGPEQNSAGHRQVELMIYFGEALTDSDGLESIYRKQMAMERQIIEVMESGPWAAVHKRTLLDQDRIESFKVFQAVFGVVV